MPTNSRAFCFVNGVATTLDTAQAAGQRATIAAMLPDLLAEEARLINAIGLLLAEPPRSLHAELASPRAEPAPAISRARGPAG